MRAILKVAFVIVCVCGGACAWEASQFEVGLSPERDRYMLGEPAYVTLEVKNRTMGVFVHKEYKEHDIRLTARDKENKELPAPFRFNGGFGCFSSSEKNDKIGPGSTSKVRILLGNFAIFPAPGEYQVKVRLSSLNEQGDTMPIDFEGETTVHFVPADNAKMKLIIDRLGEAMLKDKKDGGTAANELGVIPDERAIPYWTRVFDSKNYLKMHAAVLALGRFNDKRVFEIYKNVLESKDATSEEERKDQSSLRESVGYFLAHSRFEDANTLLEKHRKDADPRVRLACLGLHRRLSADKAVAFLKEMSEDSDEHVRAMAQMYLKEFERERGGK